MKKAISILLVFVMCLTMCACAGETKSNEIELTLENYDDYLNLDVSCGASANTVDEYRTSYYELIGSLRTDRFSKAIYFSAKAEGVSTNFNYQNVKIVIEVNASPSGWKAITTSNGDRTISNDEKSVELTCTLELELNIAGNDTELKYISLPNNLVVTSGHCPPMEYTIISISGTVTPA